MDITHDNVCSSMLSCFYSHLLSTGRPISSVEFMLHFSGDGLIKIWQENKVLLTEIHLEESLLFCLLPQ